MDSTIDIKRALEEHKKYLETAGFCGTKLIFKRADLRGADLQGANLSGANLSGADLSGADLRGADLRGADLRGADLLVAKLSGAKLSGANLSGANLSGADLRVANLLGACLRGANLLVAKLSGANLSGANLSGTKNIPARTAAELMVCPEEGSFIGWKKCGHNIIKLLIPEDARRSSATTRKCRCSSAKVLEIQDMAGNILMIPEVGHYAYDKVTRYVVGEMVYPDSFDENRWNECSNGIHFFITRQEAVDY